MRLLFFAVVCTMLMSSCFRGIKPGVSGGAGFVHEFYTGKDSTMYFFSDVKFIGQNNSKISLDYNYLQLPNQENKITCNFSLFNKNEEQNITNLLILADQDSIEINNPELMFEETAGKVFVHRYTFGLAEQEFRLWVNSSSPIMIINGNNFYPERKWKKKRIEIKNTLYTKTENM